MSSNDQFIGQTLGGCLILDFVGQGGMGVIYKARQKSLDRIVAIKILSHKLSDDATFIERFQREARAIARVNHPNVLAVYDVGDENGIYYMIMEFIDGGNLAEQQERVGVIDYLDACDYIAQAARGLGAAQASGIIHRDIKPDNLMLTTRGVLKVSDFGLARETNSSNTETQAVMGTPAFMSPEQCDGKIVDGRTDIYSLGGTFHKLITGRLPFEAETAMSMMYRHKHEALIPPHEIIPTIPKGLSDIIVRMMQKRREDRYQSMQEVIDSIEDVLSTMDGSEPEVDMNKTVVFEEASNDDSGPVDDGSVTVAPRNRRTRSISQKIRRQRASGRFNEPSSGVSPIESSPDRKSVV